MNDDGYKALGIAIVQQAVSDCRANIRNLNIKEAAIALMSYELSPDFAEVGGAAYELRQRIKKDLKWFKSPWCEFLLQESVSGDKIIAKLRENIKFGG